MIDKLRVAGFMKSITQATRSLSSLSYGSFVSHKDSPSLVTFKSGSEFRVLSIVHLNIYNF